MSFDDMWSAIAVFCTNSGQKMFANLNSMLNRVRSLRHFNGEAERAFYMLTDAKHNK